jgi:hypothetical protein
VRMLALILAATAAMTFPLVARSVTPSAASSSTTTAPPPVPVPVSVQRRPDGSVCVTISLQLPQCVGPVS